MSHLSSVTADNIHRSAVLIFEAVCYFSRSRSHHGLASSRAYWLPKQNLDMDIALITRHLYVTEPAMTQGFLRGQSRVWVECRETAY